MLADMVTEYIRQQYAAGKTQAKIAEELNVDNPTINRIISGKRKVELLTIGTFQKMFPHAAVDLRGAALIHAPQNRGNVVGINNGHMGANCLSEIMDKILSTEELTAEEKIKFLKVLKK